MKTYSDFLIEYDARQLAGASPKLAAAAQRRQRQREMGGGKGSAGSSSPINPKMNKPKQENQRRIAQGNNKGLQSPKAIVPRQTTRAVDKPGALAKGSSALAKKPADKGSAIVRQKQGAPSKDAVGKRAPSQKGFMTSPDGVNSSRIPKPSSPSIGKRYSNMKKSVNDNLDKTGRKSQLAKDAWKAAKWVGREGRRNIKSAKTDSASAAAPKGQTISKYSA